MLKDKSSIIGAWHPLLIFSSVDVVKVTKFRIVFLAAASMLWLGCRDTTFVSSSMAPTIAPGETVTVDYTAYALSGPKRFDVVAFEPPIVTNEVFLKRVIGLPGETVFFTNGSFTVDGSTVTLPADISNVTYVALGEFGVISPFKVPKDSYFVLGDNSANSRDSRFWGSLPRTNILGRVKGK